MESKRVALSEDGIALTMPIHEAEVLATEIERINQKDPFRIHWVFNDIMEALAEQDVYPNYDQLPE